MYKIKFHRVLYHINILFSGLRITPFIYYIEVVALLIEMEKSYDTLPNFTAADCKCSVTRIIFKVLLIVYLIDKNNFNF